ncbi:tRNA (adenosine(37)-N6)-threonylcarbamoyltransferase complex dimerization subunit type 1 TsaB [Terriglobus sp.]|uniref:tRNA (adenosine(37)-N6)-threonylcarbamoyltransferase complex dimerization subunit type 1 TsaB n=1 Tax=Terriglobus sp. TaxID=1889013 RepID=UPI003AFFD618
MASALVIDTCGQTGYVAVVAVESSAAEAVSERRLGVRATQEELLPAIEAVLEEARTRLADLTAVVVVSGPGSFTGVRIGLAAAKGLCEAENVSLVTLSRLAVLAAAVSGVPVWAWLQAGRGEVYMTQFEGSDSLGAAATATEETPEARVSSLHAALEAAGQDAVAVCEEALQSAAPSVVFVETLEFEAALRAAAAEAVRECRWSDVALSDAMYLRVPDAELALRASRG